MAIVNQLGWRQGSETQVQCILHDNWTFPSATTDRPSDHGNDESSS